MKKLIAVALLLSASTSVSAMSSDAIRTTVICEEGYKFLVVYDNSSHRPPSVVQIFRRGIRANDTTPPQPMKCTE